MSSLNVKKGHRLNLGACLVCKPGLHYKEVIEIILGNRKVQVCEKHAEELVHEISKLLEDDKLTIVDYPEQIPGTPPAVAKRTKWYVIRESGGKFSDGWYGWDATVHSTHQIYAENDIPFKRGAYQELMVGIGEKPDIYTVIERLKESGFID